MHRQYNRTRNGNGKGKKFNLRKGAKKKEPKSDANLRGNWEWEAFKDKDLKQNSEETIKRRLFSSKKTK